MQLTGADIGFILHAYDVRKDATLNNDPNIPIVPYSEYTDSYRFLNTFRNIRSISTDFNLLIWS